MQITDPEDGILVGTVAAMDAAAASAAMDRAAAARDAARTLARHERRAILDGAADRLAVRGNEAATLIAREGVKMILEARAEVGRALNTLRLSAEAATRHGGTPIAFDAHPGSAHRSGHWSPELVGVVVAITPFNDPLNLVAHKVGPAVAASCPVVLKPHEATPLSALLLAECLAAAGLPDGHLQVVTGQGAEVGPALVTHPEAALVSFTGGLATGRRIAAQTGLVRLVMELGSSCPTIVMADADPERAARACVAGAIAAAGQNCLHVQRVIVEGAAYDAVRDAMIAGLEAVRLGPKRDEATEMGCLIDAVAADRVASLVNDARSLGARLLAGGARHGTRMAPVLLEDVPEGHAILRDEVFGPVTAILPTRDLSDAIARANATPFGLQSAIFTRDIEAAHRATRELRAGTVIVNDSTDYRLDAMPFGGVGASGIGREGVEYALAAMTEPKVVCFTHAQGD